jgi:hypothetical protein
MKDCEVIIKFDSVCEQDQYSIKRINGVIKLDSFVKLVDIADMDANPRKPKVTPVTRDIQGSLESDPLLFQFKTKGILLSCYTCKVLERKRYKLIFNDPDIEGILDGGHNTLAISLFILQQVAPENKDINKIKTWDELKEKWNEYRKDIHDYVESAEHLIPLEILTSAEQEIDSFASEILEISQARNNNSELTQSTKDNKSGYYDRLREHIDEEIRTEIEWKANDGGRIKVADVVALSLIPISLVSEEISDIKINPVQIFSSKGACIKTFGEIFEKSSEQIKGKGSIRRLSNETLDSALKIMEDIPRLYDLIDLNFGDAYNNGSSRYGGLKSVKFYEEGKYKSGEKDQTYLRNAPETKFYEKEGKYKNPEAYFIPIVVALRALMEVHDGLVRWVVDNPDDFIKKNLSKILDSYRPLILALRDPAQIGKSAISYQTAENALKLILAER